MNPERTHAVRGERGRASGEPWTLARLEEWAAASRSGRARLGALPSLPETLAISEEIAGRSRAEPTKALGLARFLVQLTQDGEMAPLAAARRCRAHMFRRLGRYREALRDYRRALDDFDRLGLRLEVARTAIGTVDALGHMGRDADARRLAARARRIFAKAGEPGRAARLDVNLGLIAERSGKPRDALRAYRRAAATFERLGATTDLALARFNEANALVSLDQAEPALQLYRSSAETWRSLGATATLCRCQLAIGSVLFRLGRLDEALRLLEETSDAAAEVDDPEVTATAALDLARAELLMGRLEPVAARLDAAIEGFRTLAMHADQAESFGLRGSLRLRLGGFDEALADWTHASEIYRGIGHEPGKSWADFWRAECLARLGRAGESRVLLRGALRSLQRRGAVAAESEARLLLAEQELSRSPAQARRHLEIAGRRLRALRDPWLEVRLWMVRARLARRTRDPERARLHLERAYGLARRLQSLLPLESLQALWLGRRRELFDLAFDLGSDARWMLRWSERARTTHTSLEDLATSRSKGVDAGDADLDAFQRAREALHWLDARERARRFAGNQRRSATRELATWRRRRVDAMKRLERYGKRLELRASGQGRRLDTSEPEPEAIQAALGADEVMLEYFVAERAMHVLAVTRTSIEAHTASDPDEAREAATRLCQVWDRYRLGSAFVRRHEPALAATAAHLLGRLRELLLDPILPRLSRERIVLSPHAWLRTVPFHAMLEDPWRVRYVLSARSLLRDEVERAGGERALIIGVASEEAPGAEREALAVARDYPGATVLLGDAATHEAVRTRWSEADLVHVAAHGTVQAADPRLSGLQLRDGTWTVHDVRSVETRAHLVVLSSCQSGETVLWGTDHQVGLLPALFERSAPAVIASLWPAEDQTTGILMSAFHHELSLGRSAGEALEAARRVVREVQPGLYHWAPFVLYGADRRGRIST